MPVRVSIGTGCRGCTRGKLRVLVAVTTIGCEVGTADKGRICTKRLHPNCTNDGTIEVTGKGTGGIGGRHHDGYWRAEC